MTGSLAILAAASHSSLLMSALSAFAVSLLACVALIATRSLHGRLSMDGQTGVQKVHRKPTPRIGGVALLIGATLGGLSLTGSAQTLWWGICLTCVPAFGAGLAEDLTKRVGVKWRLSATIVSGFIWSLSSGYAITRVGLPGADPLLALPLFSLLFTAFAIGGIANAINIIDGFHGLAAGTGIIVLCCFGWLASRSGDAALLACIVLGLAVLLGFLVLNFPFGRIFLGDAGAYSVGFLLAAIAVALPARNPEISPLVGLIALAYPVTETMVSVWRRMQREGTHPGQPDRLHLHSLVYRSFARTLANRLGRPDMRNPLTSVIVWTLPVLSSAFVIIGDHLQPIIPVLLAVVVLVYLRLYRRVALLGRRREGIDRHSPSS